VVVAAGNDGNGTPLRNPAMAPFVTAVGASAGDGAFGTVDSVTTFANRTAALAVDVLAPGQSIISLRAPGSYADLDNPSVRVDDRLFKGSGSSQAAAVVSGAVALILEQRPCAKPNQVKNLLMGPAVRPVMPSAREPV
jgi:serine protease AprX